ncbi:MAG: 1-acyl-sn-glycerol-3-phosphate acyltransferase [Clostridia bacterium]|nr:1-acyl-sn-glycerol-3-phosphate acyltransferase [Clostridia bacterium]
MKIKVKNKSYEEVMAIPRAKHKRPMKQSILFRTLLRVVSAPDLFATKFECNRIGMERLGKNEPCLFLMNHSSFIDLKIASTILYPRPFNIVTTTDGFVGKNLLMRRLGCIPTKKFVTDVALVRDMLYVLKKLKSSVLMYPEAGYSFDGTATPLPNSIGKCLKLLGVPVVMIRTYGAFARDPLYNNLQLRRVRVSADMTYLLSPEDIAAKSAAELGEIVREAFTFDNFRWQQENEVEIDEPFRADCLNRVLYKCPVCHTEGEMKGEGTTLTCGHCGKKYILDEYGFIRAEEGETAFSHVPDWYAWERRCVAEELEADTYLLDTPVDIYMLVDTKCLYRVGEGRLVHSKEGFRLTGCDGKLDYQQDPTCTYTLNSDFNWYEIGDVIGLGNNKTLSYCFPKDAGDFVAKTRLATEELYKLSCLKRKEKAHEGA